MQSLKEYGMYGIYIYIFYTHICRNIFLYFMYISQEYIVTCIHFAQILIPNTFMYLMCIFQKITHFVTHVYIIFLDRYRRETMQ